VVVCHCDSNYTKEYDDIACVLLDHIPSPDEWPGRKKTLVILEDLEFKGMSKQQKQNLDRLFGYVSTHKNISVALCAQDAFNVPPCVRRCANLFVLWKCPDMDSMSLVARKAGLTGKKLSQLFEQHCPGPKDSIWRDMSDYSPASLRVNGFKKI
jgi:hypothetical protein